MKHVLTVYDVPGADSPQSNEHSHGILFAHCDDDIDLGHPDAKDILMKEVLALCPGYSFDGAISLQGACEDVGMAVLPVYYSSSDGVKTVNQNKIDDTYKYLGFVAATREIMGIDGSACDDVVEKWVDTLNSDIIELDIFLGVGYKKYVLERWQDGATEVVDSCDGGCLSGGIGYLGWDIYDSGIFDDAVAGLASGDQLYLRCVKSGVYEQIGIDELDSVEEPFQA